MLFDLALAFNKRRQIKQAVRAICDNDWQALANLMEKGLSPNQFLPASFFPDINRQGPSSTTPFLAMSMRRIDLTDRASFDLVAAFSVALGKGADLSVRGDGDTRSALDHQANVRSLGGWELIAAARALDYQELADQAASLNWPEGEHWARNIQTKIEHAALNRTAPPGRPTPGPRL